MSTQSGPPKCPTSERLHQLITLMNEVHHLNLSEVEKNDVVNALSYLDNFLTSRRGYQKKVQIKRKVLAKYAKEHGFDEEIDQAVRAMHANVMDVESLDDLEDIE